MKRLILTLLASTGVLLAQVAAVPNTDFPTFRSNLNTSLGNAANITGSYVNPAWLTIGKLNGILLSTLNSGLLKNTTGTGVPSIALYTDIVGAFSACSGTQYLGADGACHTAVTSIATTGPLSGGTIITSGTISCPTCVSSSAPGVGIAHFAGSTQTVTSSAIALGSADVSGTLPAASGGTGQTTYTKGDLLATPGGAVLSKLAVGTDGQVLTADSTSTNGVKWGAGGGGGGTPGGGNGQMQINSSGSFGGQAFILTGGGTLSAIQRGGEIGYITLTQGGNLTLPVQTTPYTVTLATGVSCNTAWSKALISITTAFSGGTGGLSAKLQHNSADITGQFDITATGGDVNFLDDVPARACVGSSTANVTIVFTGNGSNNLSGYTAGAVKVRLVGFGDQ